MMAKKRRLGSDPLSWINDSRQEKPTEEKPADDENTIEKISDEKELMPSIEATQSTEETCSISEMPDDTNPQSPPQAENNQPIPETENQIKMEESDPTPVSEPTEIEPSEPVSETATNEIPIEPEPIKLMEMKIGLKESVSVPIAANLPEVNAPAAKKEPSVITPEAPIIAEDAAERQIVTEIKDRMGKYLTFYMADEEYAIEILKVQEIIGILPITPVPNTLNFIRGVINLRGQVIPVMELRIKFGMELVEYTEQSCIIVVQSQGSRIGIIVDKVSEVTRFVAEDIDDTPSFGNALVDTEYILGVGKSEGHIKLLLDIDKVLQINHE
jgi:purine-binding chemotaxis protein CheW